MPSPLSPIGVFDSGIGGMSVLKTLQQVLPEEHFIYLADNGYAPYGERGDAFVQQRSTHITHWMCAQHDIKALVIACNTATAAAIERLRLTYPHIPIIGVEPAVKPAALHSQTHVVGIMATHGTVHSTRLAALLNIHATHTQFVLQACNGLAQAIEDSTSICASEAEAAEQRIQTLCSQYTTAMGTFGLKAGNIDTLVLGCTHYIFATDVLRPLVGPDVTLIDTSLPVARHTQRRLQATSMLRNKQTLSDSAACQLFTTGDLASLQRAAKRWLQLNDRNCTSVQIP